MIVDDGFNLKMVHMNKEKSKKTLFIFLGVLSLQSSVVGPFAGGSPSLVHNTQAVLRLRWLCEGACLPSMVREGIPVQKNRRIYFFSKTEESPPENVRGYSYRNRGWIPIKLEIPHRV
jgi:hypothetical protein